MYVVDIYMCVIGLSVCVIGLYVCMCDRPLRVYVIGMCVYLICVSSIISPYVHVCV